MLNPLEILHIRKGHLDDPGWPIRKEMVSPTLPSMKTLRSLVPALVSTTELKYAAVTMYQDYKTMPIQTNRERVRLYINHLVRVRLDYEYYDDWLDSLKTTTTHDVVGRLDEVFQMYHLMEKIRCVEVLKFMTYAGNLLLDPVGDTGYDTRPLIYYSSPHCGWVETHVLEPQPHDQDKALAMARQRVEEAFCEYETAAKIEGCHRLPDNMPGLS